MDFDKTVECYRQHGLLKEWDKVPEKNRHSKEKLFFEKYRPKELVNITSTTKLKSS
jgi:hypothetical protein